MELESCASLAAVVLLWTATTRATILYPTDGHSVVPNTLINPKDTFITNLAGDPTTFFITDYLQGYVDKKGGLYTSIPKSPVVYFDTWKNSELNFVEHPTGELLLGDVRDDSDQLLTRATNDVRAAFGDVVFQASYLFVMTYANFTADGTANPPMDTFQMLFIVGANGTYLELNYPPEKMGWWKDSSGIYPTMMIRFNDEPVMIIPKSGTPEIQDVIQKGNTPNVPGRWMFKIDGRCPQCVDAKSGYMLSCINGNVSLCLCSSCNAESLDDGLTAESILIIVGGVCLGLATIGVVTGFTLHYKKTRGQH